MISTMHIHIMILEVDMCKLPVYNAEGHRWERMMILVDPSPIPVYLHS